MYIHYLGSCVYVYPHCGISSSLFLLVVVVVVMSSIFAAAFHSPSSGLDCGEWVERLWLLVPYVYSSTPPTPLFPETEVVIVVSVVVVSSRYYSSTVFAYLLSLPPFPLFLFGLKVAVDCPQWLLVFLPPSPLAPPFGSPRIGQCLCLLLQTRLHRDSRPT